MSRATGNPPGRPKKIHPTGATYDIASIEVPDWIDGEGRELLEKVLPQLESVITENDLPMLFQLASAYSLSVSAAREIQLNGLIVDGVKGRAKNPAIQIFRDATLLYSSLAARFGLAPTDRAKLQAESMNTSQNDNSLLDLIRRSNE